MSENLGDRAYAVLENGEKLFWGCEPIEPLSSTRGRRVLNGLWRFMPALGEAYQEPTEDWGFKRVPGTWYKGQWYSPTIDGIIIQGKSDIWSMKADQLNRAWYEREIHIPLAWDGREIILRVDKVSTDAAVFIDGIKRGEIRWPGGEMVITPFVTPGQRSVLRMLVVADKQSDKADKLLGSTMMYTEPTIQRMQGVGLVGNVILESRPRGTRIEGLFIKTSVRKRELELDIDFVDAHGEGKTEVYAVIVDDQGKIAKEFKENICLLKASVQTHTMSWKWEDPKLWDYKQPNLYTLRLTVQGEGFQDEYVERFGFREFRAVGKGFLLNEIPFRFRPVVYESTRGTGGLVEAMENWIEGYIAAHYNVCEIWPRDTYERGNVDFWPLLSKVADEKGFPLMYPALSVESFVQRGPLRTEEEMQAWKEQMVKEWKEIRNHPSIIALVTTPNRYYHPDDQNPLRIGSSQNLSLEGGAGSDGKQSVDGAEWWINIHREGAKIIEIIRRQDPTRPITSHHASVVGDIHTMNTYLNLIPLQEREEWLSFWAEHGDKPFMAVEFGVPFMNSMLRGRNGFGDSIHTEPLMTECAAIYLGSKAYEMEAVDPYGYRAQIVSRFVSGQSYSNSEIYRYSPTFLKIVELFIKNTWRSWRTWGITGGMQKWSEGYVWKRMGGDARVELPSFAPGRIGSYSREFESANFYNYLPPKGLQLTEAGMTFMGVNRPTLAWIGGPKEAFTAKDHHFYPDQKVQKQIILINDERSEQKYDVCWDVYVDGKEILSQKKTGQIEAAQNLFLPFDFMVPEVLTKTEGQIVMTARIGEEGHKDTFTFRVYPRIEAGNSLGTVMIYDPQRKTSCMLEAMGWKTKEWDGKAAEGGILVVGRSSLDRNGELPGSIEDYAKAGGRVVIFAQDPEWLREKAGFRIARHVSRRFFPIPSQMEHPILKGLDSEDFRDWNGRGTLVPEAASTELDKFQEPHYGYHWGNRGSVSSAAIEKPHFGGWTPILEGEFDLAYTPLMERQVGKGLVIWCTLDVEDRGQTEPMAEILTSRILHYAKDASMEPFSGRTIYLGNHPEDHNLLNGMGLIYEKASEIPNQASLLIIGRDYDFHSSMLCEFVGKGGKVLFLGRDEGSLLREVELEIVNDFGGALEVPDWKECKGLSPSDLRLRTDIKAPVVKAGSPYAGAKGLMARVVDGDGTAVVIQLTPDRLQAEQYTYLRYSSWRLTRTIAQVISNLGGEFTGGGCTLEGKTADFYCPGFMDDVEMGDDPYRFYRW